MVQKYSQRQNREQQKAGRGKRQKSAATLRKVSDQYYGVLAERGKEAKEFGAIVGRRTKDPKEAARAKKLKELGGKMQSKATKSRNQVERKVRGIPMESKTGRNARIKKGGLPLKEKEKK